MCKLEAPNTSGLHLNDNTIGIFPGEDSGVNINDPINGGRPGLPRQEREGILPGGCYRPAPKPLPSPFDPPIFGGGGIDMRDKYEREEMFEQKTGWMDSLVDRFNFDDTRVFNQNGKTVLDAGMGSDTVNVTRGKDGGVTVDVNGRKYEFTAEEAKNLEIRGGSGNDRVTVADNVKTGVTIRGGSGDDTIRGGGGNDMISGGSGNDTISGGRGNDWIHAGSGDDKVSGGRGDDTIYAGSGDDAVSGGRGDDNIHGGTGRDAINGGRGDDNITRDFEDRFVTGGRGDDQIGYDLDRFRPRPIELDRPFRPFDMLMKNGIRG